MFLFTLQVRALVAVCTSYCQCSLIHNTFASATHLQIFWKNCSCGKLSLYYSLLIALAVLRYLLYGIDLLRVRCLKHEQ